MTSPAESEDTPKAHCDRLAAMKSPSIPAPRSWNHIATPTAVGVGTIPAAQTNSACCVPYDGEPGGKAAKRIGKSEQCQSNAKPLAT